MMYSVCFFFFFLSLWMCHSARSYGNKRLKHNWKKIPWQTKEFWMCLSFFQPKWSGTLCILLMTTGLHCSSGSYFHKISLQSVVIIHDEADSLHDCCLKFNRLSQYKAVQGSLWQYNTIIHLLWLDVCGNERPFISSPRQSHQQLKWSITLGSKLHSVPQLVCKYRQRLNWCPDLIGQHPR